MKLQFALLLLVAVSVRARNVRDIGLHLQGDHAHEHHHHEEAAASSASAASKQGYGRDVPEPALPVTLTEPAAPKQSGYPRENPANPLKIDAQPANEVEVRVQPDQSNNNNMMMMGGEIPGTAGVDYPIYDTVPETSFKCEDQATGGYYADEEARCQVFHICHDKYKSSFLCPNGTLFQQKVFVCDWWFNVDCSTSKDFFNLNAQIGVVPEKAPETDAVVAASNDVGSPSLEYLPPKDEPVVQEPETSYLPPATAVEAIANGILAESAPAPVPPSQNYLPPQ